MNARHAEIRTRSDLQAQIELERLLAARRSAEAAREARFRKLPTPAQPQPANFCAAPEADAESPLPLLFLGVLAGLAAWALFGWAFWALVDALRWSA